jgi:hypothetical protein
MAGGRLKLTDNGTIDMGVSNQLPTTPDFYYVTIFTQDNTLKLINSDGDVFELGLAGQIPVDTTANILAISSPNEGAIRYSSDDQVVAFYNGTNWIQLQNNGNL